MSKSKKKPIGRRTFITKGGTALAGLTFAPGLLSGNAQAGEAPAAPPPEPGSPTEAEPAPTASAAPPEISVVSGPDPFKSTLKAIELLGGMSQFVSKGDRVALLMNTWNDKPGTYTSPAVTLAVGQLCYEAGAREVVCLKDEDEDYWELLPESKMHQALIKRLPGVDPDHREIKVRGRRLQEADILETALDYERLINLPIIKDHSGVKMTGCLKNMMGLASFSTNVSFHLGDSPVTNFIKNIGEMYPDLDHFAQCVADLQLTRKADLCVLDATEFITTNGPGGPGKLATPGEVIAGTDPVAIDALACRHLGLEPRDVHLIRVAHQSGAGELDPGRRRVQRASLG